MNILIVNDDGISARGIKILAHAARPFGKVRVVAPNAQQSAVSQGITIHEPLKIERDRGRFEGVEAWSISGTPADCVKVALQYLRLPIDVVFSGVNDGPNLGTDILYSGTVAGATEAAIIGIPAAAFSMDFGCFDIAEAEIEKTIRYLLEQKLLCSRIVLNINFPLKEHASSQGFAFTTQGERLFSTKYRHDNGKHWQEGHWLPVDNTEESDVYAVSHGFTSITPLGFDRTDERYLSELRQK